MINDNWFEERSYFGKVKMGWKIRKVLHSEQSKFQKIDVVETEAIGKLLLLDGKTMVADIDEFVYHEVMAHIPYAVSRSCKKVLIIGGGDGGVCIRGALRSSAKGCKRCCPNGAARACRAR